MTAKPLNTFEARDSVEWREWLALHHDCEAEVWLVFYKRHTGHAGVAYADAVDEALCFGWIDSLVKRLDDERYARNSPRASRTANGPPPTANGLQNSRPADG